MSAFCRAYSPALLAAIQTRKIAHTADLVTIMLADGVTILRWTTFDMPLTTSGLTFTAQGPWLARVPWAVKNTMEVPQTTLKLSSLNTAFNGGATLQAQINEGLFDGAAFLVQRAMMGTDLNPDTLGVLALSAGKIGAIDCDGVSATITGKGKVNDLDQYAPRNLYQTSCLHAFCDTGCTLARASFTDAFTVGSGASASFIPWATAPASPQLYQNGTLAVTSGAAAGGRRTIAQATSAGLTLVYPLAAVPAAGDTFTAFQGCDKSQDSGSVQSCSARGNTANFRAYPNVPPPASAY